MPDKARRALIFFYRSRFTRNYSSRYMRRAVELLSEAANAGNSSAMSLLAIAYEDAWGVEQDLRKSIYWLHRAADADHRLASHNLGVAYDNGIGVIQSHAKAFHYYRRAALLGDAEAMQAVGSFYLRGHGVPQSFIKARKWYRKSARSGRGDAMHDLARCYQRRVDGNVNPRVAVFWFEAAIKAGCLKAHTGLAIEFIRHENVNWELVRHHLELAAENNHSQAMYLLGRWAEEQWDGSGNLADARFWYKRAADLKHHGAILQLAQLLSEEM